MSSEHAEARRRRSPSYSGHADATLPSPEWLILSLSAQLDPVQGEHQGLSISDLWHQVAAEIIQQSGKLG